MNSIKKTITCLVILTGFSSVAFAATGYGVSGIFTIDNRNGSGTLSGMVIGLNGQGQPQGALVGVTVSLSGVGDTTTKSQGEFDFGTLAEGTYTVVFSMDGYLSVSRSVFIGAEKDIYKTFQLTESSGSEPLVSGFASPDGKHFIEGMPGDLAFSTDVAWNGSPGTVRFNVAGTWHTATLQDLGSGMARATLTVPAPAVIGSCTVLTIEVTNGESIITTIQPEVYFYPIPQRLRDFYQSSLVWNLFGHQLNISKSYEVTLWSCEIPSGVLETEGKFGFSTDLSFDLFSGAFSAATGIQGGFDWTLEFADVENMAGGRIDGTGNLELGLRGFDTPTVQGSLSIDVTGKAGLGAPAVLIVDVVFPPASPFMTTLRNTPVVGEIVKALRLRIFLLGGVGTEGHWSPSGNSCWFGASSWDVSGTFGIEGQVLLKSLGTEVGIYAGGTGTPTIQVCPEWQFQGVTIRGYVGVFASAWLFSYSEEVGWETTFFEPSAASASVMTLHAQPGMASGQWCPIGTSLLEWGEMNRLVADKPKATLLSRSMMEVTETDESAEEVLVENVTKMSSPSVVADANEALILYSAFDPAKSWYAATDIGTLRQVGGGAWSLDLIADDTDAEFSPRIVEVDATTNVAAWERVLGDVSEAAEPGDIAPHLEIVTSRFDRTAGTWSTPIQLTSNAVVDRDPQPVVMGTTQGILWIQNQAGDSPGNTTNGDSLLFAEWDGSQYLSAQTLWSGQKGIISITFAADAADEGYVVLAVDEDGDPETRSDRELYQVSTTSGIWQTATWLTNDGVEDAVPVLVAVDGVPVCVWSADGTVSYTKLAAWNPQEVYTEYTTANEAMSLDGVAMPGGTAIAYTVQGPEGMDIMASFYDAVLDKWSLPRQLTQDEHAESSLSLACDGTDLVIAYLKTQTERNDVDVEIDSVVYHLTNVPQPARTDLYVLRHQLGYDLAVRTDSVAFEPENPPPGSAAIIKATLENRGDLGVEDVEIAFYDGDPNDGGTLIDIVQVPELLVGGSSREVSISWSIPTTRGSGDVYVVADPALIFDDRDRSNNTVSKLCMLPDLMVETAWYNQVSSTSLALTARTSNTGAIPSGAFELSWRLDSADGPEIGRCDVDSLEAGATHEVAFVWDTQRLMPQGWVNVYVIADDSNVVHELDETNNALSQSVMIP